MIDDNMKHFVEKYRVQMIHTLSDLVAIPTVNPPGESYKTCVEYLSDWLKKWQIKHKVIPVSEGKHPRFSILGEVGQGQESLHLHGHYDVVPSDSPDQFTPYEKEDRLYGRGSSDMKSGLVTILYSLRYIQESGPRIKGKITFSFVPDEEGGGGLGTQHLLQSRFLPRPSLGMLMPEPTSGVVWSANKGALTYRVTVHGKAAHVALEPQGRNAFESMVSLVHSLLDLKQIIRERKTSLPVNPPEASQSVMLIGGQSGSGMSFNVVPDKAHFTIDRRINPEEKLSEAKQELSDVFVAARRRGIELDVEILQEGESSAADQNSRLALALKDSIIEVTGCIPSFELCPGILEIRYFNNQGVPAYAYGPGLLEVSHGPEEYVRIPDLLNCTEVFIRTLFRLLS